jgi:tetratricopeptide (TPR) repeat protein
MKQRLIATVTTLAVLFFVATIGAEPISAQQPTPTPEAPAPVTDLERRMYQVEAAQTQTVQALGTYKDIIIWIGVIMTTLVSVQSLATGVQLYREGRREARQARREEERAELDRNAADQVSSIMSVVQQTLKSRLASEEQMQQLDRTSIEQVSAVMNAVQQTLTSRLEIESAGVKQVSEIMGVVQQTLESHLKIEEQAEKMVTEVETKLKKDLEDSRKKLVLLQQFYENFQAAINRSREAIEDAASRLVGTPRHAFRRKTDELNSFAQQLDTFEFKALDKEQRVFSPQVPYIRGIAAHYASHPMIAKQYLKEVVDSPPYSDEDKRHIATAYYYLGLTECNFSNYKNAIEFFKNANNLDLQLDPEKRDFLTPVVTAEAYAMKEEFDTARQFIDEVEDGLKHRRPLRNSEQRVLSRAILIGANMAILERKAGWEQKAQQLLERVYKEDRPYYYATATLAQVYHEQGKIDEAREFFHKAYESIESSNDLLKVTEARSRILLLMVAGMCCKQGLIDDKKAEQHLDEADHLCDDLPTIGDHACTVFSTLSKRNENRDAIRHHIGLIRGGKILL